MTPVEAKHAYFQNVADTHARYDKDSLPSSFVSFSPSGEGPNRHDRRAQASVARKAARRAEALKAAQARTEASKLIESWNASIEADPEDWERAVIAEPLDIPAGVFTIGIDHAL